MNIGVIPHRPELIMDAVLTILSKFTTFASI